jgi:hypothetical protein
MRSPLLLFNTRISAAFIIADKALKSTLFYSPYYMSKSSQGGMFSPWLKWVMAHTVLMSADTVDVVESIARDPNGSRR